MATSSAAIHSPTDIFLSHDWQRDEKGRDNHKRVAVINDRLKSLGFNTWFDQEHMSGEVRRTMISGIKYTRCVIVFLTKAYMAKVNSNKRTDNCKIELNFAFDQEDKEILCVCMDDTMSRKSNWNDVLQAMLGPYLYVTMNKDFSKDYLDNKMDELLEQLRRKNITPSLGRIDVEAKNSKEAPQRVEPKNISGEAARESRDEGMKQCVDLMLKKKNEEMKKIDTIDVADTTRATTHTSLFQRAYGSLKSVFDNEATDEATEEVISINIQPAHEDHMARDSIRAGTVALPSTIPDVPVDQSEDLGTIHFSISYDVFESVLKLLIKKAVGLPAKDLFGGLVRSDPFVRIHLLPDVKHQLETAVKKKALNPVWDEMFTFEGLPHQKLIQRRLCLQVLSHNRVSKNDEIGEVKVPLCDVSLQKDHVEFERKLKNSAGYHGYLLLALCYKPHVGHLTVIVMKRTKLKPWDVNRNPYVKVNLMSGGQKIAKRKTTVKERSLDPVWNEVMVFEVPVEKVREIQFIFTVMDFDMHLPNKAVGQVVIGYRSAGAALKHWTDIMNCPMKSVPMWHQIKLC